MKYYNLINQSIIVLFYCWNVALLLEPVGTMMLHFLCSVGTKKRSNAVGDRSNKLYLFIFKLLSIKNGYCWNVGTLDKEMTITKIKEKK